MAMSLIKMFREGPDVSFKGSPTVSPMTAAACSAVPFYFNCPLTTIPVAKYFN